jgi:hypothetical protein
MLSLLERAAKMLVGMTDSTPLSGPNWTSPARAGSSANSISTLSAELPTNLPMRATASASIERRWKTNSGISTAASATAATADTTQTTSQRATRPAVPLIMADLSARGIVVNRNGRTHICSSAT